MELSDDMDVERDALPRGASAHDTAEQQRLPWVEKYRPRVLGDIRDQDDVVNTLRRSLQTANLPHLLFYGPPGTGKTSTILAVARELYGPDMMRIRVKELNASDDRGINVVREQIKTFAKVAVSSKVSGNYPCPPYKIIVLDEADSMTNDAQSALRRVMEATSKVTRFCLICNYVSRIIEPIASRCAKFRFKPLASSAVFSRLEGICNLENIKISGNALQELYLVSRGDMRVAINVVQSAQLLHSEGEEITVDTIREIAGVIPDKYLADFLEKCKVGLFQGVQDTVRELIANGFAGRNLLEQFQNSVDNDESISDMQKARIAMYLAESDSAFVDGADEYIQMLALGSFVIQTLKMK